MIEHMFDTNASSLPHELLASIAATLNDLSVRVERLDSRIDTVVATRPGSSGSEPAGATGPTAPATTAATATATATDVATDEWVWDGNRAWPRSLGRPAGW